MSRIPRADVLAAPDRPEISVFGARVRIAVHARDTGGAFGVIDYRMPAHYPGPPAHIHPGFDDVFIVQEGRLTLGLGDEQRVARQGDTALVPGGVVHTFANLAAEPTRVIIIVTPGGFESFFEEVPSLIVDGEPDIEAIGKLLESYGVTTVGPPLS